MKKLLTILLLGIFLLSFTSAHEFDDVKEYDTITRTATIYNCDFWFITCLNKGDVITTAMLESPLNVKVGAGEDQLVGWFTYITTDDFVDSFGELYLEDLKNGKQMTRGGQYKVRLSHEESVYEYKYICSDITNVDTCNKIITGSHIETIWEWKPITNPNINLHPNTLYQIGIFVDVEIGDYGDWKPTFSGKEISEWAEWTEDLNVDITSFWKLDEQDTSGSGLIIDSLHINNGTNNGADNDSGIINTAYDFDGVEYITLDSDPFTDLSVTTISSQASANKLAIYINGGWREVSGLTIPINSWNHLAWASDASEGETYAYLNGVSVANYSFSYSTDNSLSLWFYHNGALATDERERLISNSGGNWIGREGSGNTFWEGKIDEIGTWGRLLSQTEIVNQLFNNGDGISYTDSFLSNPPSITLNSPSSENFTTPQTTTINFTAWDDIGLTNVQLYVNGVLNQSNASGINNTNYLFDLTISDGEYIIYGTATDNESQQTNSSSIQININTVPFIEFLTPPTLINNSNITQENIPMKINTTTTLFKNITYSLRNVNGTNLTQFYTNETFDINFTDIPDAHYHYDVTICTTTNKCNITETRHINHDATPPEITITTPKGEENFIIVGNNQTLNYSISDINLDACWFSYNGINQTLNCSESINEFLYILGVNELTIYANDTLGSLNATTTTWEYKLAEINQTFNNETLEGAAEDFLAIIRLGPGKTIAAVAFIYNGSAEIGTSSTAGDNTEIKIEGFIIPQISADINLTFKWSILLTGGEIINLTSNNQTVRNIDLDNCSSFTNQILNMTMVDEEHQFELSNTTIEIAVNLLSVDRTSTVVSLSGEFDGENPLGVCLSENITENIMYSMDAIIKYTSIGYAIEYYNLVNSSLSNESTTQSITLYNLNSSDSTDFQLTFNGEDFLPVEGALIFVERQYIAENTFKTVELPKTDSNGQTILHLVRNDVVYNIRVVKEGVVLATFLNIIAFCEDFTIGDCTLPLNAQSNTTGIFNYDTEIGILYNSPPVYNETLNTVSFDFTSTDGSTKIVKLTVERRDIFGNNSICDNTIASPSGTVSCNIGLNLSDTSLFSTITVDGEDWIEDTTIIDDSNLGSIGFIIWFILALSLVLMFSGSKNGVMVSIAISYIGAVTLGLSSGTLTGIGSAGIWILVMTSIGIWKINKNRST